MERFTDRYPESVTQGEDGICRWSCTVDLQGDPTIRNMLMKVIGIVCGSILIVMLTAMYLAGGDLSMAWIPVVICLGVPAATFLGWEIYRRVAHNRYTMAYEMDEESITTIQKYSTQRRMENAAIAMAAIGAVTQGAGMYGAAQPATTKFRSVRKLRSNPETARIDLRTFFTRIQVWVPKEDYEKVLAFIREHTAATEIR